MTARIRSDLDRQRVVQLVATTSQHLTTPPHTVTHLRAAIDARIEDGMKAASYDEPSRGGSPSSERVPLHFDRKGDPISDKACEDLGELDRALALWAEAEERLNGLIKGYPIYVPVEKGSPGEGPCPIGACKNCWSFGRFEHRSERYKTMCDICGRWFADHGERMIEPLWRLRVVQGKARVTTGDLRKHAPHLLPKEQSA